MTTKLNFGRDVQGYNTFAPPPSTNMYSATLASGGNSTITLPTNVATWIVAFSFQPGSDIWVAYNGTAAPPAGSTFASNISELLPGSRVLNSTTTTSSGTVATTINLYNNGAGVADVGVILYAIS
jgi:hypothetical protein